MQEKRQFPRKRIDVPVIVSLEGGGGTVPGTCRDASMGGVYVETEQKAPFGTKVRVSFVFPGVDPKLSFPAIVRWLGADGLGLQFGLLGARETHAIALLVKACR